MAELVAHGAYALEHAPVGGAEEFVGTGIAPESDAILADRAVVADIGLMWPEEAAASM